MMQYALTLLPGKDLHILSEADIIIIFFFYLKRHQPITQYHTALYFVIKQLCCVQHCMLRCLSLYVFP